MKRKISTVLSLFCQRIHMVVLNTIPWLNHSQYMALSLTHFIRIEFRECEVTPLHVRLRSGGSFFLSKIINHVTFIVQAKPVLSQTCLVFLS